MNKKLLISVAIASTALTLRYGFVEQPMPFNVPGLNVLNSKRFVAGIAMLSVSLLLYQTFKKGY